MGLHPETHPTPSYLNIEHQKKLFGNDFLSKMTMFMFYLNLAGYSGEDGLNFTITLSW